MPDDELMPTPADAAMAEQAVGGGPVAGAGRAASGPDDRRRAPTRPCSARAVGGGAGKGRRTAALRNLLVYGPFALAVLVVQIVLLFVANGSAGASYALGCGVLLPVTAFALGWLASGSRSRRRRASGWTARPLFGAVVCLVPAVLVGFAAGVMWIIS